MSGRAPLDDAQLSYLASVDSPTIANAIELLKVRDRRDGFVGGSVQCQFPELGVMVGRALTVTMRNTPGVVGGGSGYWPLWDALNSMDGPVVIAIADGSGTPSRIAYAGEIMCTLAQRLGAVGMITDGALRDVAEARALGFHYFMRYPVVSHANFDIEAVGEPIVLDGERIETGDILHGDLNGVAVVPDGVLDALAGAVAQVQDRERDLMGYIRSTDFDFAELKRRGGYSEPVQPDQPHRPDPA